MQCLVGHSQPSIVHLIPQIVGEQLLGHLLHTLQHGGQDTPGRAATLGSFMSKFRVGSDKLPGNSIHQAKPR